MRSVFSQIIAGEIPASFVYRDEIIVAFMDIRPINPGHVLVVPVQPAQFLYQLDDAACERMLKVARDISRALRSSGIPCEGVNLLLSDGEVAGQEVPHVHMHILPRYRNDGFGFTLPASNASVPDHLDLDGTAEKIRRALQQTKES